MQTAGPNKTKTVTRAHRCPKRTRAHPILYGFFVCLFLCSDNSITQWFTSMLCVRTISLAWFVGFPRRLNPFPHAHVRHTRQSCRVSGFPGIPPNARNAGVRCVASRAAGSIIDIGIVAELCTLRSDGRHSVPRNATERRETCVLYGFTPFSVPFSLCHTGDSVHYRELFHTFIDSGSLCILALNCATMCVSYDCVRFGKQGVRVRADAYMNE